jgi:serine/threonine-protein kinase
MGVVYLARDTALDRKVAIKSIFSKSAESETQQLRLMREAKAAGALSHPHIATVYDVFDDQGSTYIVMEYVAGASVAATIAELPPGRTLPPETALRIVRETASALDYAHDQGIIHRDIKPANLLLDKHGSVKVVDFGIAKMADSNTDLTHGAPIGTVAYMSPEQINSDPLTGRADQFSLAATAYVLFAGQSMFPQAESISSLMFKNCFEQPVPVSAVKFGLPQAMDEALTRGLAKKAPERFSSCTEFAAACDRAFQNPVTSAPLRLADASPKPKTGVIVWSLMVLAGILVAVLMTMSRPTSKSAPVPSASTGVAPPVPAVSPIRKPAETPKEATKEPLAAQNGKRDKESVEKLEARLERMKKKLALEQKELKAVVPPPPYAGPGSGQFVWTGALNSGDSVTISGTAPEVSGAYLPGVPVELEIVPPVVTVVTAPAKSNKFKTVVLKNTSGRAQNLIIVKWKVLP